MLRSFRVGNHKSIREEVELLLMPAYDKSRPVVPVAGIFGANASGKSNLLDALRWMQRAVRTSFGWEPNQGVHRRPYRIDDSGAKSGSTYCVELLLDSVRYTYGFEVDDEAVTQEWLYVYPHNRRRIVFERDSRWTFGTGVNRSRAENIRDLTRSNALFLSVAARFGLDDVMPVYGWFQLLRIEAAAARLKPRVSAIAERLRRSRQDHDTLVELVNAADLGISDIEVRTHEQLNLFDEESEVVGYELLFRHGPALLPLTDQSEGTYAWLRLAVPALRALERGSVLCVDEIDSSLHPRLTARLIELFKSAETNRYQAQLVFTTHDATLLGTSFGREILARDEVWFVEKGLDGATSLFPLSDFHPRKEENTERRYLGGSYGAVPAVFSDSLVENLVTARTEAERAETS